MSMNYSMILVPDDPYLRADSRQIGGFLGGLLEMGVLGEVERFVLKDYQKSRCRRVGRNPSTGDRLEVWMPEIVRMESFGELVRALEELAGTLDVEQKSGGAQPVPDASTQGHDQRVVAIGREARGFDAWIEGTGTPHVMPIQEIGAYVNGRWTPWAEIASVEGPVKYVTNVACCQRLALTSTSDLHDETPTTRRASLFGEPCGLGDRVGLYSNPETADLIDVPGAGCSTFWIDFHLENNWVFPRFTENRIAFAEPRVLQLAEDTFGARFLEGCRWG